MILAFWMLSFKPTFSLSFFTFIKRLFSSSLLSAIRVVSSAYLSLLTFLLQSWFQLVLHPAWHFAWCTLHIRIFSGGSVVKNLPAMLKTSDVGSIPGSGRSSGAGNGSLLQYSCLENSMGRGACGLQSIGLDRTKHACTHAACKLDTHDDSIQPWHTPFPIWNQSVVPCAVLTVAAWPSYRFLRR